MATPLAGGQARPAATVPAPVHNGSPVDGFWVAEQVEDLVDDLLDIKGVEAAGAQAAFRGVPRPGAGRAFAGAAESARARGFDLALLVEPDGRARVSAGAAQTEPPLRKHAVLQLMLLAGTLVTTTWAGALHRGVNLLQTPERWELGVPYALALLLILAVHELGHYVVARRRGVEVTLPYFIPVPLALGTFGAFIRMGGRIRDRRAYFDVGIAGPLAGLVVALGAVWFGLRFEAPIPGHGMVPASSALFAVLYGLAGGTELARPVGLGPVAFAGWLGLIVTAFNLVPVGQLDGGHVAYALLGRHPARTLTFAVLGLVVAVGLLYSGQWLMWGALVWAFAGTDHPAAQNELTPLGLGRTVLAFAALAILLAIVLPWPF